MIAFHLVFDLQMFGLLPYGTTAEPFFYWHARLVAGSFLFLAGFSLWLAHREGIRWQSFWWRWGKLAAAAALVTGATYLAMPDYFVFFGILHTLALASLLGLLFLRLPAFLTAGAGALVMLGSYVLPSPTFNAPLLRFLGLATEPTLTVDFEPIFPWVGPFLIGLACAKTLGKAGALGFLKVPETRLVRWLAWPGQHSLTIYLIHQPVLMGLIWVYVWLS